MTDAPAALAASVRLLVADRPPDRLGASLLLALVVVGVIGVAYLGLWRGWRRRGERVSSLPPLPDVVSPPPDPLPAPLVAPLDGVYVGSVGSGGWQDEIVGRGRGKRSGGRLVVTQAGVDVAGLWLPREALTSVRVGPGLADRVAHGPGLVVLGWDWDGHPCESGFRGQASRYPEVVGAVEELLGARS